MTVRSNKTEASANYWQTGPELRRKTMNKLATLSEAVAAYVKDGCHLALGGFVTNRKPYAAVREIREETGLTVKETDSIQILNPCAFSTPGMTDESNAFLCAEITLDNLDDLNQNGAEGSERFDGFELLDRKRAEEIFRSGRDEHGNTFSLATWMVLSIFLMTA